MPRNKNLTKNELINLVNYRCSKAKKRTLNESERWWNTVCSIRQQLQLHKYDGVGEVEDWTGLVIFNPSFVKPIELFEVFENGEKRFLKKLDNKKFIFNIDKYYEESKEDINSHEKKDWDYIRSLEDRFCRENGLL